MKRSASMLAALLALCLAMAAPAAADPGGMRFASIDGGEIALGDWAGRPVLVANTASLCAFTEQYEGLQALYDMYRGAGLVVLAVPSDDFRQELATEEEVAAFCEANFGLDLPMAEITSVRGPDAHPFYRWLNETHGIAPRWNFEKVLIGPDGALLGAWGSAVRPLGRPIVDAVEAALAQPSG